MSIRPWQPTKGAAFDPNLAAFEAEWERCAPWIEAALAYSGGSHDIDDVKACVSSGEARLWGWPNSALVTEVQTWPKAKFLLLWLAGGDLDELRTDMLPHVETYGREQNCTRIYLIGRPGWAKALPGYRTAAVSVAKEL